MGNGFSFFERLIAATPDEYNTTNDDINKYHEIARRAGEEKDKAQADVVEAKRLADAAARLETEAKRLKEEAIKKQLEAKTREEAAKGAESRARRLLSPTKRGRGESKTRGGEKEEEAAELKRFSEAALDAQKREREADVKLLEAQQRLEYAEKHLKRVTAHPETPGGIRPEVWPTEKEFKDAKDRIKYDTEKIHFAVCGSSGSGKSSLINAFRGLKNNSPGAAGAGITETTKDITRYPDPRKELPYDRLVWFDCPGAGTLSVPSAQYFNQQGLFIFDVVILVYDTVIIFY